MKASLILAAWPLLYGVAARVTILVLAALLADRVLRRRSAWLRHGIWRATLWGTIALGIGAVVLPSWHVALLPQRPPQLLAQVMPTEALRTRPEALSANPQSREIGDGNAANAAQAIPIAAGIVAIWLIVLGVLLLRMLLGRIALGRAVRPAHQLREGPVAHLTAQLAHELGVFRPVRVLLHETAVVPYTFGVWQSTLVLPIDAAHWHRDRLERVITHELGHVRRADAFECVLVRFVTAFLWFHPGVWLLSRRLAALREAACDDIVLLRGARASDYAADLLHAVRSARALRPPEAVLAMASRSELGTRLSDILDASRPRRIDARATRRLMGAACVLLAMPLAALSPSRRQSSSQLAMRAQTTSAERRAMPRTRAASPSPARGAERTVAKRPSARRRVRLSSPTHSALVAARLASLDSICAITNGRTRGERLVALADHWIEDARFLEAFFRVLDGIPGARVRAEVVVHALTASRTSETRSHARAIIDGLPDRGLREAMFDRLSAMDL